jgi:hypothetical protein
MMARVTCPLPTAWKDFSTLVRTPDSALSQASSLASSGGTVVVVGAAVVAVVLAGAAVGLAVPPPHPPISRTSRTGTVRRAGEWLVLTGMVRPSSAATRRGSRATRLDGYHQLASSQPWAGAAAAATSCDAPCPTGRAAAPSRRGPQSWRRTLHLALPSRKRRTWSLSQQRSRSWPAQAGDTVTPQPSSSWRPCLRVPVASVPDGPRTHGGRSASTLSGHRRPPTGLAATRRSPGNWPHRPPR